MGKRINTLNTASSPANDDYLPIDGATNGTRKISADFVNNLITDVEVDGTSVVTSGVAEIDLSGKQDTLTAGSNIQIAQDGTISATDTTYTAGTNVDITGGVISATDTTYTAGTNVTIDANNVISASDTTYTAGTNVQINNGVISATDTTYSAFGGATAGADGSSGLVPQPLIADKDKFLKGDGTWDTIQPGASALDDLTNVDITSPTNGQVLKYDSTNQEWVNANESGGGGSTVTITPTLSTGTKIADYSIDGSTGALYAPNGGGGGSSVIPNPTGTPTDTLDTISIDGTIYEIQGSGGGGGSGFEEEQLYKASSMSFSDITVDWDWDDYDLYILYSNDVLTQSGESTVLTKEKIMDLINNQQQISLYPYGTSACLYTPTANQLTANSHTNNFVITEIVGVKFGTGGGGGNLSYETVFSGSKSTSAWNSPLVFNEFDVTACDIIRITAAHDSYSYTWLIDTSLIPLTGGNKLHIYGEVYCDRDDTELQMYVSTGHALEVSKIESVISGGGGGGGGAGAEEMTLAEYNELTEQQKNDGTIRFIPENPYGIITDVDMSTITNLSDSAITVTPSADEIEMDFDHNDSYRIGGTFYISAPINVTNYDYLKYDLTTGVCYNSLHSDTNPLRNLGIGLCRNAPSTWQYCPNVNWAVSKIYDVNDVNSTFTDEVIDVSKLTGTYYFVVAFVAWEATISNLKFATAGGYPSQIKYMSKTYALEGDMHAYSTTEHQVGTWIDGSDVYEKTISISNVSLSSGSYETVDTITGLDTIISCNGYAVEGNLKYTLNDITLRVIQDGTSVKLYSPSGTTWTISSGAIIIRYTKVAAS